MKSRVVRQPVGVSVWVAVIVGVLHVSVALEAAATLASSGNVVGLQPKANPVVGTVRTGLVVSTVHV